MSRKLPERDILQLGLQVFKLLGEYTDYTPKKIYCYRIFNTIVFVTLLFFILMNCLKTTGIVLVKILEGAITTIHVSLINLSLQYNIFDKPNF